MLSWCLHGEPSDEALMEGNTSIRDVKSPRLLAIPHFNSSPGDRQDLQGEKQLVVLSLYLRWGQQTPGRSLFMEACPKFRTIQPLPRTLPQLIPQKPGCSLSLHRIIPAPRRCNATEKLIMANFRRRGLGTAPELAAGCQGTGCVCVGGRESIIHLAADKARNY